MYYIVKKSFTITTGEAEGGPGCQEERIQRHRAESRQAAEGLYGCFDSQGHRLCHAVEHRLYSLS